MELYLGLEPPARSSRGPRDAAGARVQDRDPLQRFAGDAGAAGSALGLADAFDAVLSVDAVGVFKTHPRVYQHALDALGLPAQAIAFQSSNAWDAHGASDFGMRVVWCNRYGQRRERLPGAPDLEVRTLAELPGLLTDPG